MLPPSEMDALRSQADWVVQLARRLVVDPNRADDLAQDAWVAALQTNAGPERASRPWLAGVLRNLARNTARADQRREAREQRAPRPSVAASTADVVEEVSLQRAVSEATLALEEPYRTTLLLRFYKGLSLAAIARREGVATSTVHARVERGLALMRTALDDRWGGDRRAWVLALIPMTETAGAATASLLGVFAVSAGTKIAATALVAGGAVGLWYVNTPSDVEGRIEKPAALAVDERAQPSEELSLPQPEATRRVERVAQSRAATDEQVASTVAGAAAPAATFEVRAIDGSGSPLPHVGLRLSTTDDEQPRWQTDERGSVEIAVEDAQGLLLVADPAYTTLMPGARGFGAQGNTVVTVVAGPAHPVAGWVVDATGNPVEGARVSADLSGSFFRRLGLAASFRPERAGWHDRTDARGRFSMPSVGRAEGIVLVVKHPSHQLHTEPLPDYPTDDHSITLQPVDPEESIWGIVVDDLGDPVPDAYVTMGAISTTTDVRGHFILEKSEFRELDAEMRHGVLDGNAVRAIAAGHLPATIPAGTELVSPLELQLGGAPANLEGRVVDPTGQGVPGAVVWIRDLTHFGQILEQDSESAMSYSVTQESLMSGDHWGKGVLTDETGAFRLEGLLPRTYQIEAFSPTSLANSATVTVPAGATDAELVLDATQQTQRVAGVITSISGEPVPGMMLKAQRVFPGRTGWSAPHHVAHVMPVQTDEEGRFEFEPMVVEGTYLQLLGHFLSRIVLDEVEDPSDIVYRFALPCRLQLDYSEMPDFADTFQVFDDAGNLLEVEVHQKNMMWMTDTVHLERGLSSVVGTDERAATLVLTRHAEVVDEIPLRLDPSELNLIGP